ncbi:MAG: sodium-translocating pyrophosphatase [Phycisphaerales bacterium]|nr:sodium-translocating pyrophosphatase [Phycisphaerales bacterium]
MAGMILATMTDFPWWPYALGPLGGIFALVMAVVFSKSVMQRSEGDSEMVRIAQAVRDGAMAYLVRQYKVVAAVFVVLVVFLGIMYALGLQSIWTMLGVPVAGLLSGLCGWFGMKMATNASARTAFAAKESLNDGLTVAFRSGAVMGLIVVGLALLDVSFWFLVFNAFTDFDLRVLTTVMLSFGMGASTQALFARVGGGIYTKAADVGADLVGKVEAGIPEDDARNPATIADNVGDNVGDVAGMGADLYESYYGSILATLALGAAAAFTIAGINQPALAIALASVPIGLAGLGIFCSIAGVYAVKAKEGANFAQLLKGLHMGVYAASALIILGAGVLLYTVLGMTGAAEHLAGITSWWRIWLAIIVGLMAGNVIAYATEYYTSYEHRPTQRIAEQALTGPATVIISGVAEGMKSTWASLLTVVVAIIAAFTLSGGGENFLMGLYGVGIAAVGMLSTLGITLATDAYGPIADNAGGNAEMTGQPPHVRERTDMLDSLGNTTAATGKGFAIGSAALTALALFAAYIQIVQTQITSQSVSFARANQVAMATDNLPVAQYEGYGKFVIVAPPREGGEFREDAVEMNGRTVYVDGAMLVDREQETFRRDRDAYSHMQVGQTFKVDLPRDMRSAREQRDLSEIATADIPEADRNQLVADRIASIQRSRLVMLIGEFDHGDHSHEYRFAVVSSRNGQIRDVLQFYGVTLANPALLGGIFLGVLLAFLFCALTMNAVGRAAYAMMGECRRQFAKMREAFRAQGMSEEQIADPMQWPKQVEHEGKQYPDYATCVSISTAGAQKEMIVPALLAILIPIGVGIVLGVPGVMGLLAGGLTSGFAVAVFMANAGGAWDNAKKLIESYGRITANDMINDAEKAAKVPETVRDAIRARAEEMVRTGKGDAYVYGKGSDDHKATVVGDTVGDPFKDTSGPSLNILIKLISVVSVVFAGLTVKFGPIIAAAIGLG